MTIILTILVLGIVIAIYKKINKKNKCNIPNGVVKKINNSNEL